MNLKNDIDKLVLKHDVLRKKVLYVLLKKTYISI